MHWLGRHMSNIKIWATILHSETYLLLHCMVVRGQLLYMSGELKPQNSLTKAGWCSAALFCRGQKPFPLRVGSPRRMWGLTSAAAACNCCISWAPDCPCVDDSKGFRFCTSSSKTGEAGWMPFGNISPNRITYCPASVKNWSPSSTKTIVNLEADLSYWQPLLSQKIFHESQVASELLIK